ncbi:MAG TPA: ABC transporter substrate-binding protein [Candidatus Korarchaeota archaeon]|nr:ABC transporter substrate-binding protein [Candidatus Korarchaeota archaeon]
MSYGRKGVSLAIFALLVALLVLPSITPILAEPEEQLPLNKYGWLDQIVFFGEPDRAKALDMMIKGDMDAYFIDISDPDLFRKIKESPELAYDFSYGLYYDLTFNPYGPEFKNGELNPFSNPKIREAMNYVIDRDYIVDEIMGGLATPKFTCLVKALPEGQRFLDVIEDIEDTYAYNFERGRAIIDEEMRGMGAELVNGKWYYKGKPVEIKFIIRVEDARRQIGDYVANQLEKLGFTVKRMYKTSREASPLWILGDPADGEWTLYTGGWITTAVSRDDADNFLFFYTPEGLPWSPLWQAYKPSSEFYDIAKKLAQRNFKSIDERNDLMEKALWMAMKDSVRIWLVDQTAVWARRKDTYLVADYAAGYANQMWAYVINKGEEMGGTAKLGSAEVIIDPWNPIAGSDWIYDSMIYDYGVEDNAFILHPKTGMAVPINVKTVSMEVEKGLPTHQNEETKDWFNLTFVDKVEVPRDAWYAWDVKNQRMITAGEAGVTEANVKFVVNYGPILNKVSYHDGSKRTLADFIMDFIIAFERADPSSKIYDESSVDAFETWRSQFVAWRVVSEDPLVIEYYVNYIHLDAELIAASFAFWPAVPWHVTEIGVLAEENKELAFSQTKAQDLNVEWMNYIAGPSLSILKKYLDKAYEEGIIPFANFMSKYITTADAKRRYFLLKQFYEQHGHFWVADGPYYVDRADAVAHTCLLKSIRLLPYKIEKPARYISEFMIYPYVIVAFDYDKSIVWKYFPTADIKTGPEGVSLVIGGPEVNIHTKVAFEEAGIKVDGYSITLPSGESYRSQFGKVGYGIAVLIGDNLYVAGPTRYGTEAAFLYIQKNRVNKGLIIVKWEDKNGNGQVDLDEVSSVLEKV